MEFKKWREKLVAELSNGFFYINPVVSNSRPYYFSYISSVLTFFIGTVFSVALFFLAHSWEESELQNLFESGAKNRLASLQADMIRHQEVVNSIAGLFVSSQHVNRNEFRAFVKDALSRQPEIHGLSWNPLIKHSDRERYTKEAHNDGFADFQITEFGAIGKIGKAPVRDDYVAIYYIEPYVDNKKAMGFNVASNPSRLQAIEQARDSGKPVITERIRLVQDQNDGFGYLLFKAVYRQGVLLNTVDERRRHFVGVVTGIFHFNDWFAFSINKNTQPIGMDVLIQDKSAPIEKQFLYLYSSRTRTKSFKPSPEDLVMAESGLHWRTSVNELGRKWSFLFLPAPAFMDNYSWRQPWALFVLVMLITLLLTLYLFTRTRYATNITNSNVELLKEIAERKVTDIALRESEKRYRSLIDSSPDWVWEINSEVVYTYASPKVYELLGYRPDEVIGMKPFDLMSPDEAKRVSAMFTEIAASKRSFHSFERTNLHKNGELVVLETSAVPVLDDSGELLGYRGIDRDVTQRILNESELRVHRDFTDTVLNAASNIIVVIDLEGRFVRFNRAAEELTKYTSEEVLGKSVWDTVIPENYQSQVKNVFDHLQNGEIEIASQYENEWLTRDGDCCLLQWHNSVLRDEQGKVSHIVAMGYDITENKKVEAEHERLQRELQQAQKMDSLGQLTGGIAHDFNNILGIIIGYSSLLNDKYKNSEDEIFVSYIENIKEAGDRAAKLVAQMMAFSRSDQVGGTPVQIEPLLNDNIKMLRATLPSSIEIKVEIEPDLPNVLMDPVHLNQILMNLSINARDAMQGMGLLSIKLGWTRGIDTESQASHKPVKGDWIELSVSDTGSGIDAKTARNIFNPFFTTKELGKGTGMGLSVIYGIIDSYEGHILLKSSPGKGSTFRLLFSPVFEKCAGILQNSREQVELPVGDSSEILIVDDELSLGECMADYLMMHGYKVNFVPNSTDELMLFQNEPGRFSMLITDQTMPGITGLELIEEMRKFNPELSVILCSGYSDKINAEKAKRMKIEFFEKPVDYRQLLYKVGKLLKVYA